mgnify:CR=1 FL=1
MCIRDRNYANNGFFYVNYIFGGGAGSTRISRFQVSADPNVCLLYTSDAADERSSVDLGGRRIIKKKKKN